MHGDHEGSVTEVGGIPGSVEEELAPGEGVDIREKDLASAFFGCLSVFDWFGDWFFEVQVLREELFVLLVV